MAHTTVSRIQPPEHSGSAKLIKYWPSVVLVMVTVSLTVWLLTFDLSWDKRHREARWLGIKAEEEGNYTTAKVHYEAALANHPYDWKTYLLLADVLNHYLNDNENALRNYLYAMSYLPYFSDMKEIEENIAILRMIMNGGLEDPVDALEDIQQAVAVGAKQSFQHRLSPDLRKNVSVYWNTWSSHGHAQVRNCRITSDGNGFYDAKLDLFFPDGATMSLYMYCARNDIWRVKTSLSQYSDS